MNMAAIKKALTRRCELCGGELTQVRDTPFISLEGHRAGCERPMPQQPSPLRSLQETELT